MDNDWRQAPIEDREIFNFHDILECQHHHVLYHVLRIGLSSFSLQAFQDDQTGQTFYHFYFELDEEFTFVDEFKDTVSVCGLALWMECKEEDNGGDLNVQFVIEERPFYSPLVSFEFPLQDANMGRENDLNLLHIIGAIQGRSDELEDLLPNEYPSNLLRFRFSPLTRVDDEPRGYRDALLQWFIRLNKVGYVRWSSVAQTVEDVVLNMQNSEETPTAQAMMFSDIIGHKFTADGSLHDGFRVVEGRVYHHEGVDMPYEPLWVNIWGQGHSGEIEAPGGRDDGDEDYGVAPDQFDLDIGGPRIEES
ncbi:uncharacterized protein FIESC28_11399 [Fusarium coffeatum]|uniref:Uncharacterized protein n=1 Tax=Fusarium coffeatum TaxID=231269 RepID=A0A366QLY1_9HYPO|nr:uncharacterized protein FIESC28_11399 [Fusarium coffeatum]RBR05268.1 hypothetical protein FIESC28_11399 [Fusarium coffeatum]